MQTNTLVAIYFKIDRTWIENDRKRY